MPVKLHPETGQTRPLAKNAEQSKRERFAQHFAVHGVPVTAKSMQSRKAVGGFKFIKKKNLKDMAIQNMLSLMILRVISALDWSNATFLVHCPKGHRGGGHF